MEEHGNEEEWIRSKQILKKATNMPHGDVKENLFEKTYHSGIDL